MKLLKRIFRGGAKPADPVAMMAPRAPAERLAVVGDIHGCAALLDRLMARIDAAAPDRLVFVGDYVDRGEDSAAVLDRLHGLARSQDGKAVFLKGNHEEMMLRFLDAPTAEAARWLRFGGLQTLASFGIGGLGANPDEAGAIKARDALARALGPDMLAWLRGLPLSYVSGNVAVVHAAANPAKPIEAQSEQALLWGQPGFLRSPRGDGIWVIHGHVVVDAVQPEAGRIGVDTGAYATGRLSAALLDGDALSVLTASS
jgi:serine/threonine protein phosphatase 1